jgi:cytochrome c oxidase subunit 2
MRPRRLLSGLAVLALGAVLLASPAAAQSVNRAVIDDLNEQLLYVALPLTLFVEVTLIYAIYRFRNNDDPKPTTDDPVLEITWTAATGVILLFVGVSAFFVLSNPYLTPAAVGAAEPVEGEGGEEVVIDVLTYQWGYEFHYSDASVTTGTRVAIPVDRDVRFRLESADVIHSFFVPQLGLKQDVFPGQRTVIRTHATETGEYRLYCAELCGAGHARMQGTVVVLETGAYEDWLNRRAGSNATGRNRAAANSSA